MREIIAAMLGRYESGEVSRRALVAALAALAAGAPDAAGAGPAFKGAGLNHVALRVSDLSRTRQFYQDLLGLPLIRESGSSLFLKLGDEFLTFFRHEKPGLDHYCIAIENFRADEAMARLAGKGLNPRRPDGTDRVYFNDPDGLEVQLSAIEHRA